VEELVCLMSKTSWLHPESRFSPSHRIKKQKKIKVLMEKHFLYQIMHLVIGLALNFGEI